MRNKIFLLHGDHEVIFFYQKLIMLNVEKCSLLKLDLKKVYERKVKKILYPLYPECCKHRLRCSDSRSNSLLQIAFNISLSPLIVFSFSVFSTRGDFELFKNAVAIYAKITFFFFFFLL